MFFQNTVKQFCHSTKNPSVVPAYLSRLNLYILYTCRASTTLLFSISPTDMTSFVPRSSISCSFVPFTFSLLCRFNFNYLIAGVSLETFFFKGHLWASAQLRSLYFTAPMQLNLFYHYLYLQVIVLCFLLFMFCLMLHHSYLAHGIGSKCI